MQRIDQPSQIAAFSGSVHKKVLLCMQAITIELEGNNTEEGYLENDHC